MNTPLTYQSTGVDYDNALDPFKRRAQQEALGTRSPFPRPRLNIRDVEWSRGESVQLKEFPDFYIGHVNEGLGTKNLIADDVEELTGRCHYGAIAQDAVRSIVHDMITAGAHPFSIHMHCAAGNAQWFMDKRMTSKFIRGWAYACQQAGCEWDGGETAILRDIVIPGTAEISGSAVGIVYPKKRVIEPRIKAGDAIVLFAASGIHANSATLMRDIAKQLPKGYRTRVKNSKTFGDFLLVPYTDYTFAIELCLNADVEIHYAIHITGHGWR